jgi:hypothetical protein
MRSNEWVAIQLLGIKYRLEEELAEHPGDDNKALRHRVHVELGIIKQTLEDVTSLGI